MKCQPWNNIDGYRWSIVQTVSLRDPIEDLVWSCGGHWSSFHSSIMEKIEIESPICPEISERSYIRTWMNISNIWRIYFSVFTVAPFRFFEKNDVFKLQFYDPFVFRNEVSSYHESEANSWYSFEIYFLSTRNSFCIWSYYDQVRVNMSVEIFLKADNDNVKICVSLNIFCIRWKNVISITLVIFWGSIIFERNEMNVMIFLRLPRNTELSDIRKVIFIFACQMWISLFFDFQLISQNVYLFEKWIDNRR